MIKEIKSIPLATFLSQLGHEPTMRKGTRLWYLSPLRQEHTPSFKVEKTLNCWYDFGIGKGGNIIDLATELYKSTDLRYLMSCIADRLQCHRRRQSPPLLFSDTLHRVFRTSVSCHYGAAHLSLTSKSAASRHRSQLRTVSRYITVAGANGIMPSLLRINPTVLRCVTDISRGASHRRTYHSAECVMARQQNVPCSKDSLITSLHSLLA